MTAFRLFLICAFALIALYTLVTISNEGINFLTVIPALLGALGWPGQFTLDFGIYLALAMIWMAWRARFTPQGIVTALIIGPMGALLFLPYLLWLTYRVKGDPVRLLLGDQVKST